MDNSYSERFKTFILMKNIKCQENIFDIEIFNL